MHSKVKWFVLCIFLSSLAAASFSAADLSNPRELTPPRLTNRVARGGVDSPGGSFVDNDLTFVSSTLWTGVQDLLIDGGTAFVAFVDGIQIFDVSDLSAPEYISRIYLPGQAHAVALNGQHLYVADGEGGLAVVDVTDTAVPEVLATYTGFGNVDIYPFDVEFARIGETDCVFVAAGEEGLVALDATDPGDMHIIKLADTYDFATGCTLVGELAYVADLMDFQVVGVDSTALFGEEEEDLPMKGHFVAWGTSTYESAEIRDGLAYIAAGNGGLEILDVSDPDTLSLKGRIEVGSYSSDVLLIGESHALLAAGVNGIQVLDIDDPENPRLVAAHPTGGYAVGLSGDAELAGLANYYAGFGFYDFSDVESPVLEGSHETCGALFDAQYHVTEGSTYIYAIDSNSDFHIVNFDDPESPVPVETVSMPETVQQFLVEEGYLYMACGYNGLLIYDLQDPENPISLSQIYITGFVYKLSKSGDLIYLTVGESGVEVIDVSQPESPVLLDECNISGFSWHALRDGDYVLVASGEEGIISLNSMKEDSLYYMDTTPTEGNAVELAASGGTLYAAEISQASSYSLDPGSFMEEDVIWDNAVLTDKNKGKLDVANVQSLTLNLPYIYFANGYNGVFTIDTTFGKDETEAYASCPTPGFTHSIGLFSNYAVLADNFSVIVLDPPVTAVGISSFRARAAGDAVNLSWHHSGCGDSGLNVYRVRGEAATRDFVGTVAGRTDSFTDETLPGDGRYSYWLQDTDTGTYYGPATVFVGTPSGTRVALLQNSPNPFNPTTTIRFEVKEGQGGVTLNIYNSKGELVKSLLRGASLPAGGHSVIWRGENEQNRPVPSGIYYYRLAVGDAVFTKKMVMLK